MPLLKGHSKKVVSQNISEFHTGKTYAHTLKKFGKNKANKQAVAVALSTARKYAGGGYARKGVGGDDLEEQKQQAIGIRPVNPDAPPAPASPSSLPPTPELSQETTLPPGRRGPGTRAWEAMKDSLKDTKEFGMSGEFLAQHPGWLPFQPVAAAGDVALKGIQAGVRGLAGVAGGVAEDLGNPSWGDRMERDANIIGQDPEFGGVAGPAAKVAGKVLDSGVAVLPEDAAAAGLSKLKQPQPQQPGKYFGKYWHPYGLDPEEVKGATKTTGQAGSNPGGVYVLPHGEPVYIKQFEGPNAIERTYNEVLANKLLELTGVPTAKVEMTQLKGKPAVASYIVPGDQLNKFSSTEYDSLKGLREHYPAHLWTGNYDFVGNGWDNIMVMPNKQTVHIDPGGALRYRAQGDLKSPEMWGPDVQHFDLDKNFAAGSVLKGHLNDPEMQASAQRVANVTDQQIHDLVQQYGPINKTEKPKLEATLKARRDGVAKLYKVGKESSEPWPSLEQEMAELLAAKKAPAQSAPPASPSLPQLPLTDKFGTSPETKAKSILTHANGDQKIIADNVKLQSKLYGSEYGKAVAKAVNEATPPPPKQSPTMGEAVGFFKKAFKAAGIKTQSYFPKAGQKEFGVTAGDFNAAAKVYDPYAPEQWGYDALHEKLAQQPLDLTSDQKGAVSHWTNPDGYKELNGYLRGANQSPTAAILIPELDSAMTPLQQATVGWRGIHGPQADQLSGLKMGDTFWNAGYSSSTIDPRRATHYGLKSDPGVIINYHLPAGFEALYTSHPNSGAWSTAEREMLIPHGQAFEITDIEHIKAPVWDYTGKVKSGTPHDFTVYHVAPVADEAGATQLDAIKGAQPAAKPPPAADKKYIYNGLTLASPNEMAQIVLKTAGSYAGKFAHLESQYGKEYADTVLKAYNDIFANEYKAMEQKAAQQHHEPIDYAMDNDRAPPNLTSEDFGNTNDPWANHSLKFFEKNPWFAKNTPDKIKGMGTTPGLIEQIKKAASGEESAVRVLNNEEWQKYRSPTDENPKPIETPNAETDPEKEGFNRFVAFHHNTPNKGQSGYLEQLYAPENKAKAPGVQYDDEHALYALDKPFSGYGEPTGPYLGRFNKVLELYYPNAKGETFANTGNNGEQASGGLQKRIIAAAKDQGVDLVILHGMNDVGPANQTQYLIIDTKATLRAKDAKFNKKLLDKNSKDPLASHTLSGIAGASVIGAGLLGAQKEGDEKKMAKGGKVSPNAVLEVKRFKAGKIMIGAKEKAHRTVKKYAKGGKTPFEPKDHDFINFKKGGMIDSDIPGRSDYIPMKVSTGAYVLPADIPSALGQGNSKAGKVILDKMFTAGPYGLPLGKKGGKGTSGTKMSKMGFKDGGKIKAEKALPEDHQLGMAVPKGGSMCANCKYLASPTTCGNDGFVKWNGSDKLPNPANSYCCDLYDIRAMKKADGGPTEQNGNDDDHVPIIAAGGEYIIHPETVAHLGNGNMDHGHKILDKFVLHTRKEHIKTLKGLKPPK